MFEKEERKTVTIAEEVNENHVYSTKKSVRYNKEVENLRSTCNDVSIICAILGLREGV
jgi:hypothetical protein